MCASVRTRFGEIPYSINKLLSGYMSVPVFTEPGFHADLLQVLLYNLASYGNKILLRETPDVLNMLIDALNHDVMRIRVNSALAFCSLASLVSNKILIGQSGALKPLIKLLDKGNEEAMNSATRAIWNICLDQQENKEMAVAEGAVGVILRKLGDGVLVEPLLPTLEVLSSHGKAIKVMGEFDVLPLLLGILQGKRSEHNNNECLVMLYRLCTSDKTLRKKLWVQEQENGTIGTLVSSLTETKRNAERIIELLKESS